MKTRTALSIAAAAIMATSCGTGGDAPEGELRSALSRSIVISQVYGGGGNSGSVFMHDFIEIFNRGTTTVDLTGMSVQYESATGAGPWDVTPLTGSIAPGGYHLVQEDQGAGGTTALPTPDSSGTINMSASAGKVALVSTATALTGTCPSDATIIDLVGYGTTPNCFEGEDTTSAPGNNESALREAAGCRENDQNGTDFTTVTPPTPRNSASPTTSCAPSGPGLANPNPVGQGGDTLLTVSVTPGNNPTSTGIAVQADLTDILGSATQAFFDDGSNGDAAPGDFVFSWVANVADAVPVGNVTLATRITDAEARVDSSGTIVLTVATNDGPVATNDADTTNEDVPVFVDVLANDTDPENDALHVSAILINAASGIAVIVSDGTGVLYTPDLEFSGSDNFDYVVTDAKGESGSATVNLTIIAQNDPPTANEDLYPASEEQMLTVPAGGVLDNDTDPEGGTLVAALVSQPVNGNVVLSTDGSFTYTPDADFSGLDTFTYDTSDGTATSAPATVTIDVANVNDLPVAVNDAYDVTEDVTLMVPALTGVLSNDADPDSTLTAVLVSDVANGTLTLGADGSFTYVPDLNHDAGDSFTYRANDGTGDSNIATVTLSFTAVNDVPTGASESYPLDEDGMLTVMVGSGVLVNDSDVESAITAVLMTDVANGTLALAADGSFTYVPDANFNGADTFAYRASDGAAMSDPITVTLDVAPVNDAPTAVSEAYFTDEDTPFTVLASAGLLQNDDDLDGDALSPVIDTQPTGGALVVATNGGFSYTPNANFEGSDAFTYHATDGTESSSVVTVTVDVTAVNDAPSAPVGVSPAGGESVSDDELVFTWSAASDVDGDAVTYRLEILRGGLLFAQASSNTTSGTIPGGLDKGDYTWRVLANDGATSGPFSAEQSFSVKGSGGGGGGGGGLFGCSTTGAATGTGGSAGALLGLAAMVIARRRTR